MIIVLCTVLHGTSQSIQLSQTPQNMKVFPKTLLDSNFQTYGFGTSYVLVQTWMQPLHDRWFGLYAHVSRGQSLIIASDRIFFEFWPSFEEFFGVIGVTIVTI